MSHSHTQEAITVHLGQAGLQAGQAFWELACQEHAISPDGTISSDASNDVEFTTFFHETPSGQFVPRCLLTDLEPTVMDEIRTGRYHRLYHPDLLFNGKEDAGNNFARGYYSLGKRFLHGMVEKIRMIAEGCDNCQGFIVFNSYGGGTGSGLSSLFIDRLKVEFGRKPCIQIGIYPGKKLCTSTVEPYNAVLVADRTLDTSDMCLLMDNESLYNICYNGLAIECPTFSNVNRLIAPMVSSITSTMRYGGTLNCNLNELRTNLVPYPRIHFPILSYAPIHSNDKLAHEVTSSIDLTREIFEKENFSTNCCLSNGKYMSACLIYRGDHNPYDIQQALRTVKNERGNKWVNWCPTGFKVGITEQPPMHNFGGDVPAIDRSVLMVANHTAIREIMENVNVKFDKLWKRRCFLHWYVAEGMEEQEFVEARCSLSSLIHDFMEVGEDGEKADIDKQLVTEEQYMQANKPYVFEKKININTTIQPYEISEPQYREWSDIQFYDKKSKVLPLSYDQPEQYVNKQTANNYQESDNKIKYSNDQVQGNMNNYTHNMNHSQQNNDQQRSDDLSENAISDGPLSQTENN